MTSMQGTAFLRSLTRGIVAVACLGLCNVSAQAATVIWDGGAIVSGNDGAGNATGDAANWGLSGDPGANTVPGNGDTIEFSGFDSDTTNLSINNQIAPTGVAAFNVTQANDLSFTATDNTRYIRIANGGTVTIGAGAGPVTFSNNARLLYGAGTGDQSFTLTNDSSNAVTFTATANGDTLGGASGQRNMTVTGSGTGGWVFNAAFPNNAQILNWIKNGSTSLTLGGANLFTGSMTLNAGTLNINHATALGQAVNILTITGGTIDNTTGAAITTSNYPQNWSGDFTFAGTQNLDLGTGAVAMNANRQVTVSANSLTVGGVVSGSGFSLTKAGAGILFLNGANTYSGGTILNAGELQVGANTSLGTGGLTINAGTITARFAPRTLANNVTVGGDFTLGNPGTNNAITFTGTVDLGGATRVIDVVDNTPDPDATFSGVISNGGLAKSGVGKLTLSGASTYTGATTVDSGTLSVTGSLASAGAVTVNAGTLDGTGSVGNVTVTNGVGAIIANGNGGTDDLSMTSLTFGGSATAKVKVAQATPAVAGLAVTGQLFTTPANGQVTIEPSTDTGFWTNGLTNLISYATFAGGADVDDFTLGALGGTVTSRQTVVGLVPNGNNIALQINGDSPKWTGGDDNNWAIGLNGTNKNWVLINTPTPTDYLENDTVLFDDSVGSGPTAIDLGTNVSPGSIAFNNVTKNYFLSSLNGFGIVTGSLTKSGAGSLDLNTANAYAGGTTLSAGTLNINNTAALGATAGAFTITGGTIDNTTGGAITLTSNNPQNWNGDFAFTGTQSLNLGTGAVTMNASRQVTVGANTLTVGGVIGGTGFGLTKAGAGTLILSGDNTYTGATTVTAGTLKIGGNERIANTSALVVSGGTFDLNNFSDTVASLSDGGSGSGTVTNSGAATVMLNINGAASTTYGGTISGLMNIAKNAPGSVGTLTLTGANTFSGQVIIGGGGAVSVSSLNSVVGGTASSNLGAPTTVAAGTIRLTGNSASGKLIYTGTGETTDRVILIDGGTVGATDGILDHSGTGTLRFTSNFAVSGVPHNFVLQGSTAGVGRIDGVIPDDADADVTGLVKQGTGAWSLTAANTYAGGTTINGGTLLANNTSGSATGPGAVTVNSGGTLGGNGFITTSNAAVLINDGGSLSPGASAGTLTFDLGTGTLNLSPATLDNEGALKFELDVAATPASSDRVVINNSLTSVNFGNLDFSDFTFTNLGGMTVGSVYKLFDALAPIVPSIGTDSGTFGGFNAKIEYDSANFDLLLKIVSAAGVDGDYNDNDVVDSADYVLWRMGTQPLQNEVAAPLGTTNGDDYTAWRARFGNPTPGSSSATGVAGAAAVPEPGAFLLLCLGAVGLLVTRRTDRAR